MVIKIEKKVQKTTVINHVDEQYVDNVNIAGILDMFFNSRDHTHR